MSYLFKRSTLRWLVAACAVAMFTIVEPSAATAPRAHLDQRLEQAVKKFKGTDRTRVIVRVKPSYRQAFSLLLQGRSGHKVKRNHSLISAITLELPTSAIDVVA